MEERRKKTVGLFFHYFFSMANPKTGGNWPNLLANNLLFELVISVRMW